MKLTQIISNVVNGEIFSMLEDEDADLIINAVLGAYREGRAEECELNKVEMRNLVDSEREDAYDEGYEKGCDETIEKYADDYDKGYEEGYHNALIEYHLEEYADEDDEDDETEEDAE